MPQIIIIFNYSNIAIRKNFKELPISPILQKAPNTEVIIAHFDTPTIKNLAKVAHFRLYSIIFFLLRCDTLFTIQAPIVFTVIATPIISILADDPIAAFVAFHI